MADVTINYKGEAIAAMSASGTKTLETEGKYCEDDIEVVYVSPGGGSTLGTKAINANGTYNASSDNLDGYSQVSVDVPTGTPRSSSDLTANNLTVTAPAGLYAEAASKTLSDQNLVPQNIKKDVTIFGTTGTYEGSGGGSNSPIVNATISPASSTSTIDIVLPRAVTNAVVLVEATDSTLATLYASSSTVYHIVSGIFFYPIGDLNNGTKTSHKYGSFERYRPSAATFYAQHGATLSLSGTTMTLTLDNGSKFVSGTNTYTVKVWEVATS